MKKIKYDYPVNLIHECFYKDEEMTQREIERRIKTLIHKHKLSNTPHPRTDLTF